MINKVFFGQTDCTRTEQVTTTSQRKKRKTDGSSIITKVLQLLVLIFECLYETTLLRNAGFAVVRWRLARTMSWTCRSDTSQQSRPRRVQSSLKLTKRFGIPDILLQLIIDSLELSVQVFNGPLNRRSVVSLDHFPKMNW